MSCTLLPPGGKKNTCFDKFIRKMLNLTFIKNMPDDWCYYIIVLQKQLSLDDGQNALMKKVLDTYFLFFQINQSTATLRHVFASLRLFIQKVLNTCRHIRVPIQTKPTYYPPHMLTNDQSYFSFWSSPVHSSRVRQTSVAVSAMRSSSAVTIDQAPPRRRQLLCSIFSWEKTLSLQRASL